MQNSRNRSRVFQSPRMQTAGILLLFFLAALLLWFNEINSTQAIGAISAKVRFYGDYRIGSGPWQEITEDRHIPATKGDVTLRGNFHMLTPDGEYIGIYRGETPIAFYANHINLTLREGSNAPIILDTENPIYGSSVCGMCWSAYLLTSGPEDPIEILIHNPHRFGNENAVDELLSSLAFWSGIDFERDMMESGKIQRNTGLFFVIVSLVLLGSALFSALLHIPNSRIIWMFGATILSAGIYLAYSASGVSFWSELIAANTSILGFSMMFYMLFVAGIITFMLTETKRLSCIATVALGITNGLCFLAPVLTTLRFYDTWLPWAIVQSAVNGVLLFCLAKEYRSAGKKERWMHMGIGLLLFAFEADVIATAAGFWEGGMHWRTRHQRTYPAEPSDLQQFEHGVRSML